MTGPSAPLREGEVRLSAPGKLMLAGEYAVLAPGRAALVAAVDRHLRLSVRPSADATVELWHRPSFVALVGELTGEINRPVRWIGDVPEELRFAARATELGLRLCAEEGRVLAGFYATFENDFELFAPSDVVTEPPTPHAKPGLGGSAAASVLAVRAACLAQQRPLSPAETLALASASHWIEQGGSGSGADVAAAALGGALEVRMLRARLPPDELWALPARAILAEPLIEAHPLPLPEDLRLVAVWTGESSDTRVLVRAVREFGAVNAALFEACVTRISACVESLRTALGAAARDSSSDDARESALDAVREAAAAMAALGEEAQAPIITPALVVIAALASAVGCAAKPSGAGGGDCAVLFAFGDAAQSRALQLLRTRELQAVSLSIAPHTPELLS